MLRAIVIALLIVPLWPSAAHAEARIALLITNQAYRQPGAALANTHRDGEILKAALEKVGFKVWVARDTANEGALLQAIGEHVQRLAEAGPDAVGFFYYSGHGAADRPNGENFLIPTEVPLTHAAQLPLMAVRLERIMSTLTAAGKMSFVVFDACRNVPLQRADKSPFKGFAPVREQNGLLIAFATEPGNVAIDQNLYAKALADELVVPGLEAAQVFRRVRLRVREGTKQGQSPEYIDRRDYDFHFAASKVAAAAPPEVTPSPSLKPAPGRINLFDCTTIPSEALCEAVGGCRWEAGSQKTTPYCSQGRITEGSSLRSAKPLTSEEERALKPKDSFKECDECPEMVVVPAGAFTMGSPENEEGRLGSEGAQRRVTMRTPFAVGRFAVTFGSWDACAVAGGCNGYVPPDEGWGRGRRPVVGVSWYDAKGYAAWLSQKLGRAYRLLTEAEREYITRAGTTTPFWWGASISAIQANYNAHEVYGGGWKGELRRKTIPVDSFASNPWGLYQVHGNTFDWVEDCWSNSYRREAPIDGSAWISGPCALRVIRGGSWMDHPKALRASARSGFHPGSRINYIGFRVARALD